MMLLSKQGELLKKPGAKLPVFLFHANKAMLIFDTPKLTA